MKNAHNKRYHFSSHPEMEITISELREWADSECPNQSPDVIDELLDIAGFDPDKEATLFIRWPDHVTVPKPNGDMWISPNFVEYSYKPPYFHRVKESRYVEGSD